MQSVDCHDLDTMIRGLEQTFDRHSERKKTMLETLGQGVLVEVQRKIRGSGMRNAGGSLPGWQQYYVGSLGGYTAVRAVAAQRSQFSRNSNPGAITNYTENGHKVRRPAQQTRRKGAYYPRGRVASVKGYHYYYDARQSASAMAEAAVRRMSDDIARGLGGGT